MQAMMRNSYRLCVLSKPKGKYPLRYDAAHATSRRLAMPPF